MMTVHLDDEYATDREKAHEVVWSIEATRILALGDMSTNVADMLVRIDLNEDTLEERWPTESRVAGRRRRDRRDHRVELGVNAAFGVGHRVRSEGTVLSGPAPARRGLREIVFKGIEEIKRVVIRKEEIDGDEEFVLYTEGSAFGDALGHRGCRRVADDV